MPDQLALQIMDYNRGYEPKIITSFLMKELSDIIQSYDTAVMHNKQTALATVVKVDGSSYRRPGARMLITEDGEMTGAISGGCLEGDALRKAQFAIFQQQNKLVVYDTTDEDDLKFGVQLGCNGIVYILFEPVKPGDANNPINLLKKVTQQRQDAMLVTAFNEKNTAVQKGTCCVVNEVESFCSDHEMSSLIDESKLLLRQKETVIKDNTNGSILYQFIPPSTQLVIVGAGNDAQPLAEMAFLLGWEIVVIDGRDGEVLVLLDAHPVIAAATEGRTDAERCIINVTASARIRYLNPHRHKITSCSVSELVSPDHRLHITPLVAGASAQRERLGFRTFRARNSLSGPHRLWEVRPRPRLGGQRGLGLFHAHALWLITALRPQMRQLSNQIFR